MEKYCVYVDVAIVENGGCIDYVWDGALVELNFDSLDDAVSCYENTTRILMGSYPQTIEKYLGNRFDQMMVIVSLDDFDGSHLTWDGKLIGKED